MQAWYNICNSINLIQLNYYHLINKMKDKNHMTISIGIGKALDKILHPLRINEVMGGSPHGGTRALVSGEVADRTALGHWRAQKDDAP